jgi:cytochrome c55X
MSTRNGLRAAGHAVFFSCAAALVIAGPAFATDSAMDEARLTRLVRHDCGSCHGLTLRGGLGPALTATALAGKPSDYVREMILHGRNGTAMPPWAPILSPAEADWIAERLLAGFPDAR